VDYLNMTIFLLVVLPVLATVWLGLLARALVGGRRRWPLWLILLVVSGGIWYYTFTGVPWTI
jgi:hypothetical protein